MSLSTQNVRAAIALPMLLGFAALAVFAEAPAASLTTAVAVAGAAAMPQLCPLDSARSHVIVLAQAPADLGTLAIRWRVPCRA